jgi:hypothetical protein
MITFLEFPLCFFFWGEFWLWIILLDNLPLTGIIIMLLGAVLYMIIFFRLWWGIIFGAMGYTCYLPRLTLSFEEYFLGFYLIAFQFIVGLQPNILTFYVMN